MDISIVVPIYNESESVKPLYQAITDVMCDLDYKYEIILVDDGSSDDTYSKALEISKIDNHLKVVRLKRNYGQTTGLYAGFHFIKGKYVVTMDGDLQNDPKDIPEMVQKIIDGNDIVLGWRFNRHDKLFSRKIPSKIANFLVRKVTGIPVKDNGCAIRAYRSEIIKQFPMYSEMHRLMPVITALTGAKFTQIKVRHHSRKFGESKYGLSRIYKVLIDLVALKTVFASFYKPLFGFGNYALTSAVFGTIALFYSIYLLLKIPETSIVIPLGVSLLFMTLSMSLLFIGVICHLVYKSGNLKIEQIYKNKISL